MDCPVCKNKPMVVLELAEVEIDYCFSCRGIWLDAGELELLLEGAAEKDSLLQSLRSENSSDEKPRRCPICLKKMEKILCGKEKKVLIDKCRNNHGLWFDKNELYEIIAIGSFDKDNKILSLLEDIFKNQT